MLVVWSQNVAPWCRSGDAGTLGSKQGSCSKVIVLQDRCLVGVCHTCTPMKKRDVPSTSAIGAIVSMFQNGMPPFLRSHRDSTEAQQLSAGTSCSAQCVHRKQATTCRSGDT